MLSSLRTALLTSAVSLVVGCGFFTLEDEGVKPPAKPGTGGSTGTGGAGGMGAATGGAGATTGGAGGSAGSGGALAGTGGALAGTGGGGALAGSGGTAGGAGGSAGAGPLGGMAGSPPSAGAAGTGIAGGGALAGAGGGAPMGCAALSPGAQAHAGHCYLAVSGSVTWSAAKAGCEALGNGAHLVTISSASPLTQAEFDAENAFVFNLGGSKETWIGATDGMSDRDAPNGTPYAWVTGEAMTLDKWRVDPMEPNNYNKACANGDNCFEHCGAMLGADPGPAADWNDDLCEATKSYVCEWEMG
jgi:hypothetical protein